MGKGWVQDVLAVSRAVHPAFYGRSNRIKCKTLHQDILSTPNPTAETLLIETIFQITMYRVGVAKKSSSAHIPAMQSGGTCKISVPDEISQTMFVPDPIDHDKCLLLQVVQEIHRAVVQSGPFALSLQTIVIRVILFRSSPAFVHGIGHSIASYEH
jgi:hypothetical protein